MAADNATDSDFGCESHRLCMLCSLCIPVFNNSVYNHRPVLNEKIQWVLSDDLNKDEDELIQNSLSFYNALNTRKARMSTKVTKSSLFTQDYSSFITESLFPPGRWGEKPLVPVKVIILCPTNFYFIIKIHFGSQKIPFIFPFFFILFPLSK